MRFPTRFFLPKNYKNGSFYGTVQRNEFQHLKKHFVWRSRTRSSVMNGCPSIDHAFQNRFLYHQRSNKTNERQLLFNKKRKEKPFWFSRRRCAVMSGCSRCSRAEGRTNQSRTDWWRPLRSCVDVFHFFFEDSRSVFFYFFLPGEPFRFRKWYRVLPSFFSLSYSDRDRFILFIFDLIPFSPGFSRETHRRPSKRCGQLRFLFLPRNFLFLFTWSFFSFTGNTWVVVGCEYF